MGKGADFWQANDRSFGSMNHGRRGCITGWSNNAQVLSQKRPFLHYLPFSAKGHSDTALGARMVGEFAVNQE